MSSTVSFACSSIHNVDAKYGQIPAIDSEQNWQGKAHAFLRLEVADTTTDIWLYRLETVLMPQSTVATYVKYVPKKGGTQVVTTTWQGGKRGLPTPAAAVFGILNTGAHLHLDVPHGHTAEETLHLHDQAGLATQILFIKQRRVKLGSVVAKYFKLHGAVGRPQAAEALLTTNHGTCVSVNAKGYRLGKSRQMG